VQNLSPTAQAAIGALPPEENHISGLLLRGPARYPAADGFSGAANLASVVLKQPELF